MIFNASWLVTDKIELITWTTHYRFMAHSTYQIIVMFRTPDTEGGLTLLHSERPKLHTILSFLSAFGLNSFEILFLNSQRKHNVVTSTYSTRWF